MVIFFSAGVTFLLFYLGGFQRKPGHSVNSLSYFLCPVLTGTSDKPSLYNFTLIFISQWSNGNRTVITRCEVLTAVLVKIQVFRDMTCVDCEPTRCRVSEHFIVRYSACLVFPLLSSWWPNRNCEMVLLFHLSFPMPVVVEMEGQ
jgi:hypothetical protein